MNNNFIRISKKWYEGDNSLLNMYGDVGFGFYVYSLHNKLNFGTGSFISVSDFLDKFGLVNKITRSKYKKELYKVILKLEKDGLVVFYSDTSFDEVVKFDIGNRDTDIQYCIVKEDSEDTFSKVYYHEFNKIMKANNSLQLLIHFSVLVGHIHNVDKIAFPQIKTLSELTGTSDNTCIKNNELLQEMELIYFDNAGVTWDNGYCKSHSNTYARFDEKQAVYNYMDKAVEERKVIAVSKDRREIGDKSRSLANQITNLTNKDSLTAEEQQKLYDLSIEYIDVRDKINYSYKNDNTYAMDTRTLIKAKDIIDSINIT